MPWTSSSLSSRDEGGDRFLEVVGLGRADDGGGDDGLRSTQARAIWAMLTPRASARLCTRVDDRLVDSRSKDWTTLSVLERVALLAPGRARRPLPLGEYGPGRRPCRRTSPSVRARPARSRLYWSCIDTNRVQPPGRPRAGAWRTATPTSTTRRGSGPCRPYHVVQGRHGLLDRRLRVEAVDLVEVDVVGAEPRQRRVDLFEDGLAGQALPAGAVVHLPAHLGGEHDVFAPRVLRDRPADKLLRGAALVHVGGIPERDAESTACGRAAAPRLRRASTGACPGRRDAVAHATQRDPAHLQPVWPSRVYSMAGVPSFWRCCGGIVSSTLRGSRGGETGPVRPCLSEVLLRAGTQVRDRRWGGSVAGSGARPLRRKHRANGISNGASRATAPPSAKRRVFAAGHNHRPARYADELHGRSHRARGHRARQPVPSGPIAAVACPQGAARWPADSLRSRRRRWHGERRPGLACLRSERPWASLGPLTVAIIMAVLGVLALLTMAVMRMTSEVA